MIEDIYQRRAERLAKPLAADATTDRVPVLVFSLGVTEFGVELSALAEVFPYRGCTPTTGGPSSLMGVMNVRGDIRPLVDLSRLLDAGPPDHERGYVLMARRRDRVVALRVDAIGAVRHVERSQVNGANGGRPSRLVKSLVDGSLRIVDTDAVLAALGIGLG